MPRLILFGDAVGIPTLISVIPRKYIAAIVCASNRPEAHEPTRLAASSLQATWIRQPPSRDADFQNFAREIFEIKPDLIVVYSYSMRLPPQIINFPRLGSVNVHGGILPAYRGCNPTQWAIDTGDNIAGATMHYMTPEFDEGEIIGMRRTHISFDETWVTVAKRAHTLALELLEEKIPSLLAGSVPALPQNEKNARYWRHRTLADSELDWNWPVFRLYDRIRASVAPLPGAFWFDSAGAKHVIDAFQTLGEVARLKLFLKGYPVCGYSLKCVPCEIDELILEFHKSGSRRGYAKVDNFINRDHQARAILRAPIDESEYLVGILKDFTQHELHSSLKFMDFQ